VTVCESTHIPLNSAWVCLDCETVGNCAVRCPACASEALLGLAGVLNRAAETQQPAALRQAQAQQTESRPERRSDIKEKNRCQRKLTH
jgi:coenzyme F420-reducing hydrogenase gamma subunit